jgi:DnaJ-class molecular chaperone
MAAPRRDLKTETHEPDPCPLCRGEGVERRWEYDSGARSLSETMALCLTCGGTGRAPPRIEIRPELPLCWAWEIGDLA